MSRAIQGAQAADVESTQAELKTAADALGGAIEWLRTHGGGSSPHLANDPHILLKIGQLQGRLHAAQGLLARAVRLQDDGADTHDEPAASVAALQAKTFARDLTLEIEAQVRAFGGGASLDRLHLRAAPSDRYEPKRLNYEVIGRYFLTQERGLTRELAASTPRPDRSL